MVSRYFFCFSMLLLIFSAAAFAAEITVSADRNPVHINESFQLIFEAKGSVDDDPDFTPLKKDFEILQQNQSSNFSMVNGTTTKSKQWLLTVMAKKEGVLSIPAIAFGKDRSQDTAITVKPRIQAQADQQGDLFLEVEVEPEKAYVQGQIILTVRLLTAINIAQYGIDEPQINNLDVIIQQIGEDKQYRSTRGQRDYIVLERNYAIFPQNSGTLHMEPLFAQAEVVVGSNSRMSFFRSNTRTRRLQSQALDIEVAGIPQGYQGKAWLPAIGVQLVEEWPQNPPEFTAGEPVTWTLSAGAKGLTSAQLPELTPSDIAGLKQYPDQPILQDQQEGNVVIGLRQEKIALIPPHAGEFTLPAIEIPWWNTATEKMEVARIPERKISVAPGEVTAQPAVPVPGSEKLPQAPTPEGLIEKIPQSAPQTTHWPWISLFLGSGWFLTALGWVYSKKSRSTKDTKQDVASFKKAKKGLKKACVQSDAQSMKNALLLWGKIIYPQSPPHSLGDLGRLIGEPMQSELEKLNSALYSAGAQEYNGQRIWEIGREFTPHILENKASHKNTLEPLHK